MRLGDTQSHRQFTKYYLIPRHTPGPAGGKPSRRGGKYAP